MLPLLKEWNRNLKRLLQWNCEGITTYFNPDHIIFDPGLRIPINKFSVDIRAEVRRAFIAKGLTQPIGYNFPRSKDNRRLQERWFQQHNWIEYSVEKNKAYCFYCYLFKHDRMDENFGFEFNVRYLITFYFL